MAKNCSKRGFYNTMLFVFKKQGNIKSVLSAVIIILFLSGCASNYDIAPAINYKKHAAEYYPKVSEDADTILNLHSNIEKTAFYINSKEIITGKRTKVLINEKKSYTVVAQPEGYISKEEFIQPPYMPDTILDFTFLLGDRIKREDALEKVSGVFDSSFENAIKEIIKDLERQLGSTKDVIVVVKGFYLYPEKKRVILSGMIESELTNYITEYWHRDRNVIVLESNRIKDITDALEKETVYEWPEVAEKYLNANTMITGEFHLIGKDIIKINVRMIDLKNRRIVGSSAQNIERIPQDYLQ